MRAESLQGQGEVFNAKTLESLGEFAYQLDVNRPMGSVLWETDLSVDLNWKSAVRAQRDNALLTLKVEDGRYVDFYVTQTGVEYVGVTAAGSLREVR